MGALENMALYRDRWLRNFYRVQAKAVAWNGAPYAFVIPPGQRDPVTAVEMLNILQFGEVEIHRAEAAFTADGVEYPAGSYVIKRLNTVNPVVQILNESETKVYATLLPIPDFVMNPPDKPMFTFQEMPEGSSVALKAWYYPGRQTAYEFITDSK